MNNQHRENFRAELQDATAILRAAQTSGDGYLVRLAAQKVEEIQQRGKLYGVAVPSPAPAHQRPVSAAVQAKSDRVLAFLAAQEKRHQSRLAGLLAVRPKEAPVEAV